MNSCTTATIGATALVLCAALVGGCSASNPQMVQRPMVSQSAPEAAVAAGGLPASAEFFDALERAPLVSQDDAVNSALLLATGTSQPSWPLRERAAKELGILPADFARQGREAVTLGEVSQMLTRVLDGKRAANETAAVANMVERGILPEPRPVQQGLTGAQLVSMLGVAQDVMLVGGVRRVTMPKFEDASAASPSEDRVLSSDDTHPTPVLGGSFDERPRVATPDPVQLNTDEVPLGKAAAAEPTRTPTVNGMVVQTVSVQGGGRTEPLAPLPAPALDLTTSTTKPAIIGPGGIVGGAAATPAPQSPVPAPIEQAPTPAVNPAPATEQPKPAPAQTPTVWTPGQKLKKKS